MLWEVPSTHTLILLPSSGILHPGRGIVQSNDSFGNNSSLKVIARISISSIIAHEIIKVQRIYALEGMYFQAY